jgi:hypothetical protein
MDIIFQSGHEFADYFAPTPRMQIRTNFSRSSSNYLAPVRLAKFYYNPDVAFRELSRSMCPLGHSDSENAQQGWMRNPTAGFERRI